VRDIDTAVVVASLKVLDPKRPIREATELPPGDEMTRSAINRPSVALFNHLVGSG